MSVFDRRMAGMIIRVQRWIQGFAIENPQVTQSVQGLYALLLSKRTIYAPQGLAAAGFGWHQKVVCRMNLSIQDRLEFGVNDSDAHQRSGALLLIGWLTGLISEYELAYVAKGDFRARRTVPCSLELLGRLATQVRHQAEADYVHQLLASLQYLNSNKISAFLKGVQAGMRAVRQERASLVQKPSIGI